MELWIFRAGRAFSTEGFFQYIVHWPRETRVSSDSRAALLLVQRGGPIARYKVCHRFFEFPARVHDIAARQGVEKKIEFGEGIK
jgi:hypothetical protein